MSTWVLRIPFADSDEHLAVECDFDLWKPKDAEFIAGLVGAAWKQFQFGGYHGPDLTWPSFLSIFEGMRSIADIPDPVVRETRLEVNHERR